MSFIFEVTRGVVTALMITGMVIGSSKADDAKALYVGGGRYTCSGGGAACAQIDTNNRINTELERQRYQAQQDRADRYIQDERHRAEVESQRRIQQSRP